MESVFQILAVLTRHSTKFLYQNELIRPAEDESSTEANEATGSSVSTQQDTNQNEHDRSSADLTHPTHLQTTDTAMSTHATHLQTTDTAMSTHATHLQTTDSETAIPSMTKESMDSLTNNIFESLKDSVEKDTPNESLSSDSTKDIISLTVFEKLRDQLEKAAPSDADGLNRTICRICYGSEETHLLSLCDCKGSIAHVHLECIERWLQECGLDTCDLCKYKFITVRKPTQSKFKSLVTWITHVDNREDMEELLSDCAASFLFSPFIILLTVSGYQTIVNNMISVFVPDDKHELVFSVPGALSMLSLFTLLSIVNSIGLSWLTYIGQKHYSRWHAWYRRSTIVRIVLPGN